MYKHFFGLRENPFNVNPDPRYLYLSSRMRAALDEITYGIQARKGLIVLTGEVGTGKTTLINRLLDRLHQQHTPTAFIFNSRLEANHLFDFILADFQVPYDPKAKRSPLLSLNEWLVERYRAGEAPVLIVDEAQGVPVPVLEEIRMLLNLETPREKLLQIVLSGQPELEERIERTDLRQLKQRVMIRCKIGPLTLEETHEYIQARLGIAGASRKQIFSPKAIDAVYWYSGGIPRIVNLLCEHALISAYVDGIQQVHPQIIEEIAREFQYEKIQAPYMNKISGDALPSDLRGWEVTRSSPPPHARTAEAMPFANKNHVTSAEHVPAQPASVLADHGRVHDVGAPVLTRGEMAVAKWIDEMLASMNIASTDQVSPDASSVEMRQTGSSTTTFSALNSQFDAELEGERDRRGLSPPLRVVEAKRKLDILPNRRQSPVSSAQRASQVVTDIRPTKSGRRRSLADVCYSVTRSSWKKGERVWEQMTAPVMRRANYSLFVVSPLFRRCVAWAETCAIAGRREWPRMTASAYRWLGEPWNPNQRRVPRSRAFEANGTLSRKEI
jgi:type II secretory pathway predicted ATPase ExeA